MSLSFTRSFESFMPDVLYAGRYRFPQITRFPERVLEVTWKGKLLASGDDAEQDSDCFSAGF
jgi:hypothetical protein